MGRGEVLRIGDFDCAEVMVRSLGAWCRKSAFSRFRRGPVLAAVRPVLVPVSQKVAVASVALFRKASKLSLRLRIHLVTSTPDPAGVILGLLGVERPVEGHGADGVEIETHSHDDRPLVEGGLVLGGGGPDIILGDQSRNRHSCGVLRCSFGASVQRQETLPAPEGAAQRRAVGVTDGTTPPELTAAGTAAKKLAPLRSVYSAECVIERTTTSNPCSHWCALWIPSHRRRPMSSVPE